tara:strand:- start:141460 stop:141882 length:423 start_codon:yes stop_codon:yes gene_type:complete
MFYNEIKEVTKQPALLTSLVGFLNPATIVPFAAVGLVVITAFTVTAKLKRNNKKLITVNEDLSRNLEALSIEAEYEEEQGFEPYDQPFDLTVQATVPQPLNEPLEAVENMDDEALKKELIRQAMSELGKRSAAQRVRKKK